MYKLHNNRCRACGYGQPETPPGIKSSSFDRLIPVFSLGVQPLANDFCEAGAEHSGYAPLEVLFCPRCTLGQLSVTVRPDILYKSYSYVTSRSDMMKNHFKSLWSYIQEDCRPESVLEIGSNDGHFLTFCKEYADSVCGVDPSENLSQVARESGVQTICGIFCKDTAELARACVPKCDLIVARHVFGHVDDWRGFVKALDVVSNRDTVIVIEVPWARRLLEHAEFDTVYHEHLNYVTLKSVQALLEESRFKLHRVHEFPVHGGAIAITLRRKDCDVMPDSSVRNFMMSERIDETSWRNFAARSTNTISDLTKKVKKLVKDGKSVAAYGASAKATVWMNACGFTNKEVKFVTDTTPMKQWKCIPGTNIPVVDPGAILREQPDYMLLTAWNFAEEIIAKEADYRKKGGQFIIPHSP